MITPLEEVSVGDLKNALDGAKVAMATGKSPDQAIGAAVSDIGSKYSISTLDEARLREWFEEETGYMAPTEKSDAKPGEVLYRMVAGGRFAPVDDKVIATRFRLRLASSVREAWSRMSGEGNAGGLGAVKKVNWKTFAAGLGCGLVLGFGFFYLLGHAFGVGPARQARFSLVRDGYWGVKMDTRTGQMWRFNLVQGTEVPIKPAQEK
jgi:hypothetical protein